MNAVDRAVGAPQGAGAGARIAVVGTVVADTIEQPDGTLATSLGGIAHTLNALACLAPDQHAIEPFCRVGEDLWPRLERFALALPGVTLARMLRDPAPNPTVELSYPDGGAPGERTERLMNPLPPLIAEEVAGVEGADLTLVNFISGDDLDLAAMRRIRRGCSRVYLDVHSMALGQADDGRRSYRPRSDWQHWFDCADVVQCNLVEGATILGRDPSTAEPDATAAGLSEIVGEVGSADSGPQLIALTMGDKGAQALYRSDGQKCRDHIPAPDVAGVDPTGCGDAFGAACALAYLAGSRPAEAVLAGVRAGSAVCCYSGVPDPESFATTVRRLGG